MTAFLLSSKLHCSFPIEQIHWKRRKTKYLENKLNSSGHQNSEKLQDSLCLVHITVGMCAVFMTVIDSIFWLGHAIWQSEGILQM